MELRFWKRENQELEPWDGDDFYVRSKRESSTARIFDAFLRWYEPGKRECGPVAMDGVRFAVLPADFKREDNPDAKRFLQLGQEYIIDCRGEYGKPIGRDQIKVPETLDKNQVVVFNVIVNEYNPPLPRAWEIGKSPQRLGTIKVSSSDKGETLELSTVK